MKKITASIIQGLASAQRHTYSHNGGPSGIANAGNELVKFADDTYLIIPAENIHTSTEELENVETWACNNNLSLDKSKTSEVVFCDTRRKQKAKMPSLLSGIARKSSLHILKVTLTENLTASDHIRGVLAKCSQTMYALCVLRHRGLCDAVLQTVFQSVIVAKLLGADSRLQMTVYESKRFYAGASDVVSADKTCRHSRNCWRTVMNNNLT